MEFKFKYADNDSISVLKGVGPKKVEIFHDIGIKTIEDLALYFPKSYEDRRTVNTYHLNLKLVVTSNSGKACEQEDWCE